MTRLKAGQPEEGLVRAQRKELTRQSLLNAALNLVGQGNSFTALGIREITREAGVVPTAFYRHFRNTDELGLALVETAGIALRRMLRDARQAGLPHEDTIRLSVSTYVAYLRQNQLVFRFITTERSGGSRILRFAIRNEINHFMNELVTDIRAISAFNNVSTQNLRMVSDLVVTTMMACATDILDILPGQPLVEEEMVERLVQQLVVVFLGARAWSERPKGSGEKTDSQT
jgi:AcrR family transcriptional regulator